MYINSHIANQVCSMLYALYGFSCSPVNMVDEAHSLHEILGGESEATLCQSVLLRLGADILAELSNTPRPCMLHRFGTRRSWPPDFGVAILSQSQLVHSVR